MLVERSGFRFDGWPVDLTANADSLRLDLVRSSEDAKPVITPQADPLTDDELRSLAKGLLEPYLRRVLEKGGDVEKLMALTAAVEIDPGRVRGVLNEGQIREPRTVATLRGELAVQMAGEDSADALAMVEAMGDPRLRAQYLVRLAAALPRAEQDRGRGLLDQAIVQTRSAPVTDEDQLARADHWRAAGSRRGGNRQAAGCRGVQDH